MFCEHCHGNQAPTCITRYRRTPSSAFFESRISPSFFFTVPARNPRTLWACQPVAVWSSSIVAPSGVVRSARHHAILVVFTRGAGVFLATLVGDLSDLPRVDFLPEACTLP